MRHHLIRLLLVALLALGTGALVACGSDDEGSSSSGGGEHATTEREKKIKVAMVTDIGGLNDRGFNALAYKGLQAGRSPSSAPTSAS